MRTVTIFNDDTSLTRHWLAALRLSGQQFRERGMEFNIITTQSVPAGTDEYTHWIKAQMSKGNFDIVCIACHRGRAFLALAQDEQIALLKDLRKRSKWIVFLDIADSTGTTEFHLLPYVDRYLKKYLLKDRERYTRPVWGMRIYSEYFHEHFGIENDKLDRNVAQKENLHKVGVCWSQWLLDLTIPNYGKWWLRPECRFRYKSIENKREYVTFLRCSTNEKSANFQRNLAIRILEGIKDPAVTFIDPSAKSGFMKYMRDMHNSRTALAPFGYGEMGWRDLDAVTCGTAIIKSDMDHMETFPDMFLKNETYIPLRWDLSDMEEMLHFSATPEGGRFCQKIAENAQARLRQATSKAGLEKFADHLVKEMGL